MEQHKKVSHKALPSYDRGVSTVDLPSLVAAVCRALPTKKTMTWNRMHRLRPYLSQNGPLTSDPSQAPSSNDETNQPCGQKARKESAAVRKVQDERNRQLTLSPLPMKIRGNEAPKFSSTRTFLTTPWSYPKSYLTSELMSVYFVIKATANKELTKPPKVAIIVMAKLFQRKKRI